MVLLLFGLVCEVCVSFVYGFLLVFLSVLGLLVCWLFDFLVFYQIGFGSFSFISVFLFFVSILFLYFKTFYILQFCTQKALSFLEV